MGYRLEGEVIKHKEKADIISDGALFGSVQVPANGSPIILMADRQTAGGYTKIATVISSDLPKISQMGSDNEIVFEKISLEEAHKVYREYEKNLLEIKEQISNSQRVQEIPSIPVTPVEKVNCISAGPLRKMNVVVNGISYAVDVQEVN